MAYLSRGMSYCAFTVRIILYALYNDFISFAAYPRLFTIYLRLNGPIQIHDMATSDLKQIVIHSGSHFPTSLLVSSCQAHGIKDLEYTFSLDSLFSAYSTLLSCVIY